MRRVFQIFDVDGNEIRLWEYDEYEELASERIAAIPPDYIVVLPVWTNRIN